MKKKSKKTKKSELSLLNLKVSESERRALCAQARKYANGNVSAWLRLAGTHFKPTKSQLVA